MQSCPAGRIVAQRDSFLCSTVGLGEVTTDVSAGFNPANSVGGVCCSGVDFIVQVGSKSSKHNEPPSYVFTMRFKIVQTVSNGEWAFLMAMGTVLQKVSIEHD